MYRPKWQINPHVTLRTIRKNGKRNGAWKERAYDTIDADTSVYKTEEKRRTTAPVFSCQLPMRKIRKWRRTLTTPISFSFQNQRDGTMHQSSFLCFRCHYASLKEVVSVHPSVRPFARRSRVIFERRIWPFLRVSNDIIINDTMSDDNVIASDVSPRHWFLFVCLCLYLCLHVRKCSRKLTSSFPYSF